MGSERLRFGVRVVVGAALLCLMGATGAARAQPCAKATPWAAALAQQNVCGCTKPEALAIGKALAVGRCAEDPTAVACADRSCGKGLHNQCETVVKKVAFVGNCVQVPAGTVGCPSNCPGKPVQCTLAAQALKCECACNSAVCEFPHWKVNRTLDLGCVANNDNAKQAAARTAFLDVCGDVPYAVPCAGRACHKKPPPKCKPSIHGDVDIQCVEDRQFCFQGEVRCTATGEPSCTCQCG